MNLAGGQHVRSRVNLADLLLRRVALNPREAATLTLAVAREWDRQRSLHGPIALPDMAGIELTDSGRVVFLVVPPANASDNARALAELLGQLLGVDDEPHQAIPGGLLITMSGRLGHLELPSATISGFQTALGRFADDDPDALRVVYWRTASRRRVPGPAAATAERQRRRERRRVNPQISELRRSLRSLEQKVFEVDLAQRSPRLVQRGARYAGGVAAAILLAVMATGGLVINQSRSEEPAPVTVARQVPIAAPVQAPAAQPTPQPPRATSRTTAPAVKYAGARPAATHQRRTAPVRDAAFVRSSAGGTRGIAWLIR